MEFFKNAFAFTALFVLAIVDSIIEFLLAIANFITEFVSDEIKELEQNNED